MQRNVVVWGTNPKNAYSGGRYLAWIICEALANAGHNVFYITNNKPMFRSDFVNYPHHDNIEICLTKDFASNYPRYEVDFVLLIPGMNLERDFYGRAINFAKSNSAHLILMNFESANWFNDYSPSKRDAEDWKYWNLTSKYCSAILSNANEGTKYAKPFYKEVADACLFEDIHPCINQEAADAIIAKNYKKQKRILMSTRFVMGEHKGASNICDLITEDMRGYTLVFMVGMGAVPYKEKKEILEKAAEFNVVVDFKRTLSDRQKFKEIAMAEVVMFPSFFEGYGYPPIEALYCGTPCVAFDLPVLRETCGNHLHYAPIGDWDTFRKKTSEILKATSSIERPESIMSVASFQNYSNGLNDLIVKLTSMDLPYKPEPISLEEQLVCTRKHLPVNLRSAAKQILPESLYKTLERIYHRS